MPIAEATRSVTVIDPTPTVTDLESVEEGFNEYTVQATVIEEHGVEAEGEIVFQRDEEEVATEHVTLSPNEELTLEMTETDVPEGFYTIQVGPETTNVSVDSPSSDIDLYDLTIDTEPEAYDASVTIENIPEEGGGVTRTGTVEFTRDDTVVDTVELELDPNDIVELEFSETDVPPDNYTFTADVVDTFDEVSEFFVEIPEPSESRIEATDVRPEHEGYNEYSVEVTVENIIEAGEGEEKSEDITITRNGTPVTTESVTLDAGEMKRFTVDEDGVPVGDHDICANGECTTVTVESPESEFVIDDVDISPGTESYIATVGIENEPVAGPGEETTNVVEISRTNGADHTVTSESVTLSPEERTEISIEESNVEPGDWVLEINAEDDYETQPFTVEPEDQSDISVADVTADGGYNTYTATATVENEIISGEGQTETLYVSFTRNGSTVATESVTVDTGQTEELSVTEDGVSGGEYEICANDTCTTASVLEPESTLSVTDITTEGEQVESYTAVATIENVPQEGGGHDISRSVTFTRDDSTVGSESVSLSPDESVTISVSESDIEPGEYQICGDTGDDVGCTIANVIPPDISDIFVSSVDTISEGYHEYSVEVTVENEVQEGDGETKSLDVDVTRNGTTVATESITLDPGRTTSFTVSESDIPSGTYDICANDVCTTVTVDQAQSDVLITNLQPDDGQIEEYSADITAQNNPTEGGGRTVETEITVTRDETTVDTISVTLDPDEEDTLTTSESGVSAGEYDLCAETDSSTQCATITVLPPNESEITVTDIELFETTTSSYTVDVTVTNEITSGEGETLTEEIQITDAGDVIETPEVTLEPDETTTFRVQRDGITPGSYEVCANDLCIAFTVPSDTSELVVQDTYATSESVSGIEAGIEVKNEVVAGEGESLSLTATYQGVEENQTQNEVLSAGETTTIQFTEQPVPVGEHDVILGVADVEVTETVSVTLRPQLLGLF